MRIELILAAILLLLCLGGCGQDSHWPEEIPSPERGPYATPPIDETYVGY